MGCLWRVSEANVEIVQRLQPGPDGDLVPLVRDDAVYAAWAQAVAPVFHPDVESVIHVIGAESVTRVGLEGLRKAWLEWLAPWVSYRSGIDELIDAGHSVVALVRDFGRRALDDPEVEMIAAAVWTLRDGKVAKVAFYPDRSVALQTVGLAET
jgi:ketosteroid isomerase-like protein